MSSNKSPFQAKGNTQNLNNNSITILSKWGVKGFWVLNKSTSTSNGIINGGTTLADMPSQDTEIAPGGSRAWSAPAGQYLDGQIISSPDVNCDLEVSFLL